MDQNRIIGSCWINWLLPQSVFYLVFLGHDLKISQGTMEDPGPPLVQVTGAANCYLGTIRNLFQGPTCKNIWPIAATSFAWRHQANGKALWTHNTRLPVFLLCSFVIRKLKSIFILSWWSHTQFAWVPMCFWACVGPHRNVPVPRCAKRSRMSMVFAARWMVGLPPGPEQPVSFYVRCCSVVAIIVAVVRNHHHKWAQYIIVTIPTTSNYSNTSSSSSSSSSSRPPPPYQVVSQWRSVWRPARFLPGHRHNGKLGCCALISVSCGFAQKAMGPIGQSFRNHWNWGMNIQRHPFASYFGLFWIILVFDGALGFWPILKKIKDLVELALRSPFDHRDQPWEEFRAPRKESTALNRWVCLKIGYIPNYSHLIGIMIINHWV